MSQDAGDPHEPIIHDVERRRAGRSFTTRRVVAVLQDSPSSRGRRPARSPIFAAAGKPAATADQQERIRVNRR